MGIPSLLAATDAGLYTAGIYACRAHLATQRAYRVLAIVDTSIRADATTIDAILTAFHAHPHIQAAAAVPNANGHATHPSNVPASTTHLIGYKGRRVPSRLTLNLTKAYEQARVAYMAREAAKLPSTGTHTDIASRCIAAWASNRNENLIGGTAAFNLRATRRAQRLSKAAYIILLTSTLGLPPPGAYLAVGATCCGRTTDAYHPHSCTAKGKAHVHDAVRTCHCHLNTCHPNNSGIRQLSVEARGKNFLNGAAGQGGPDACILDSNNLPTHLDYSGYNPFTQEHIRRALAQTTLEDRTKYTTANDQTRTNTRLDHQRCTTKGLCLRPRCHQDERQGRSRRTCRWRSLPPPHLLTQRRPQCHLQPPPRTHLHPRPNAHSPLALRLPLHVAGGRLNPPCHHPQRSRC